MAAARVLAENLVRRNPNADVTVRDVLAELPAPLRWFLSDAYRWQLTTAPWLFGLLFGTLRRSRLLRWVARAVLSLAGSRAVLGLVRCDSPDVVVSTWPPATLILGSLRLRGKVPIPACATITDFAGLELWADKGVDLHLVMHESLVPERRAPRRARQRVFRLPARGPRVPRAAGGRRGSAVTRPADRRKGRRRLGRRLGRRRSRRCGHRLRSSSMRTSSVSPDAIRATRARLESPFAGEPRVRVLGFTGAMSDLLAAADVLVHSTGGVTCLEALARDCPVVAYGAPPGHAPLLAREMASLGLVVHARSAAELTSRAPRGRRQVKGHALARRRRREPRPRRDTARYGSHAGAVRADDGLDRGGYGPPVYAARERRDVSRRRRGPRAPGATTIVPSNDSVALVVQGKRRELLTLA